MAPIVNLKICIFHKLGLPTSCALTKLCKRRKLAHTVGSQLPRHLNLVKDRPRYKLYQSPSGALKIEPNTLVACTLVPVYASM